MSTKAKLCIAQKNLHYNMSRINAGQIVFMPGDDIFVEESDFPRMLRHGKIKVVDEDIREINKAIDFRDYFPMTGRKIWVFGDGPTAATAKKLIKPDDIVFAVNHCFYAPLSLVPTYYVALDDGMMTKEPDKIKELKSIRKFTNRANQESGQWDWPELRFFDVRGELGFSTEPGELYHGKTSCFCALQLAVQCGQDIPGMEINLAGIDLMLLDKVDDNGKLSKLTHHYGQSAVQDELFPRMLASIRYGLQFLNESEITWVNHSPLLASRINDLWQQQLLRHG